MTAQTNQKMILETSSNENIARLPLTVVPSAGQRNSRAIQPSITRFLYRIIKDRNLYGALAFAETAESLHLNVQAMQVGSQDRVVGVTASGDLLLSLLCAGPKAIVGFDANPAQTVLTHLKIASIQALSVEEYLQLMGVNETTPETRVATFNRVSRSMPSHARRYMLSRYKLIEEGILNHGMSHQIIQVIFALFTKLLDQETLALFLGECGTDAQRLSEMKQLTQKRIIRWSQPILRAAATRLKWLFFPHRFCEISNRPEEIIADFFNTFRDLFVQGAQSNPVLCRATVDKPHSEWQAYLYNEDAFERIRRYIGRLTLNTLDIISGLRQCANAWATRIYLSNVPDYLSEEQLYELILELQRVAAPGARFVYYSMYDQDLLSSLGPQIAKEELYSLQKSDNVLIYPILMVRKRSLR